jgi:rhodanese-related sulfurtransferase
MSAPGSISVDKLMKRLGAPTAPRMIDVRVAEDFAADPRIIPASLRMDHTTAHASNTTLQASTVVVVCQAGAKLSHGTAAMLRLQGVEAISLEGGFEAWRSAAYPLVPYAKVPRATALAPTRWVTRHRPKIDRIACPWLIRRFVDPLAEFLYVPPEHVNGVSARFGATAFDMPTGTWTHEGDHCTFDKMLTEFALDLPALHHLARIVRAADTGHLADEPQAAGLLAVSLGLSRLHSNDLEQMEAGLAIYDAMYRWCRDATDEQHSWTKPGAPSQ